MSQTELRQTFINVASSILCADEDERKLAEQQLRALQVTEEYGVILLGITLCNSEPLNLRQMTAVLLKQYIEEHWSSLSNKFTPPEVSSKAKLSIRRMLPNGLSESISKIRSTIAYTFAAIAHWDWPEDWPEAFDILVRALKHDNHESEYLVPGAIRALKDFSRDVVDTHIFQVASVILPDMYRIFMDFESYSNRTRSRCIEIFATLVNAICNMAEVNKMLSSSLLTHILPTFNHALVSALNLPDESHAIDVGLKTEVLKTLSLLLKNLPNLISAWKNQIISAVWKTLTSTAIQYVREVVNNDNREDDLVDSDGEILGFDNLVLAIFEVVNALINSKKYKIAVKSGLSELLYYIVFYMQITQEQKERWIENPNQYIEDEDENSYAYSVRSSAKDLILALSDEFGEEFCFSLFQTIEKHLSEIDQAKKSGNIHWWKTHEAIMLALGLSNEILCQCIKDERLNFKLSQYLQTVVLENLSHPASPFLFGRCIWLGSKYPGQLPETYIPKFLESMIRALQHSQVITVRLSAVRALWGFCNYLRKSQHKYDLLNPVLPVAIDELLNICSSFNSSVEILGLVIENISIALYCDQSFAASVESKVSPVMLAIFLKYNHDPIIVDLLQGVFKVLGESQANLSLQQNIVPTLSSILNSDCNNMAPGFQAVALEIIETLVKNSKKFHENQKILSDLLLLSAFPSAIQCIMKSDDTSIMQSGGECLRAFISIAPDQICAFTDNEGKSGLWYVVQVAEHLLNPLISEQTATSVGKLIVTIIVKIGVRLGHHLELLLKAVLSKLQSSHSLTVIQSLLMVYAHLINSQLDGVLNFLSSVPGPNGDSALSFVLSIWVSRQHVFYGNYDNKVSLIALVKLLQHSLNTNDTRLQNINIKEDTIIAKSINSERKLINDSTTKPDQIVNTPLLVKILKIIIGELGNYLNDVLYNSYVDDENSDDWQDTEDNSSMESVESNFIYQKTNSILLSDVLEKDYNLDDKEDPEMLKDPIYNLNFKQYLTEFIEEFSKHHYFHHFVHHLSATERLTLSHLGINTV